MGTKKVHFRKTQFRDQNMDVKIITKIETNTRRIFLLRFPLRYLKTAPTKGLKFKNTENRPIHNFYLLDISYKDKFSEIKKKSK